MRLGRCERPINGGWRIGHWLLTPSLKSSEEASSSSPTIPSSELALRTSDSQASGASILAVSAITSTIESATIQSRCSLSGIVVEAHYLLCKTLCVPTRTDGAIHPSAFRDRRRAIRHASSPRHRPGKPVHREGVSRPNRRARRPTPLRPIGRTGSIALIERLWRTLKQCLALKAFKLLVLDELERRLTLGLQHYAFLRPHQVSEAQLPPRSTSARILFLVTPSHRLAGPR